MRLLLIAALALIALILTDTKPAKAQMIVCAGYSHGIPYGCRPRSQRSRYGARHAFRDGAFEHRSYRHARRVTHERRVVYRGTVTVPRGPAIASRAPAWQPGIPPGNGRVTRVSEFDRDGQAYCDKYAPGSSFVMWIGAGMGRKARCG